MHPFITLTAHRYLALGDLKARRDELLALLRPLQIKGCITLAPEGVAARIAGEHAAVAAFVAHLQSWPGLADLQPQIQGCERPPWPRLVIRVRKELMSPADLERFDIGATSPRSTWMQCPNCRHPLTPEHPPQAPDSCPYCREPDLDQMSSRIADRHARLASIIEPLPGSVPHDQFRPIAIPGHCDGSTLLEALARIIPHIPARYWQDRAAQGLLLDADHGQVSLNTVVRAAQRYLHRFPGIIEPDVNMRLRILHEDEALLVIDKPAPLPMHAGGRFHRNTLKYVLDALYAPEQPRPAHRLDANTSGVLVAARTQFFAGKLQTQFARGCVEKVYLVRVNGHALHDLFECEAPISIDAGHAGSRVVDTAGLPAHTKFRVLARADDGTSVLEARPLTGRTNQIRVHLWHLGLPVHGDSVYLPDHELGDSQTLPIGAPPLCLHAWQIAFMHPLRRQPCRFTAPPPEWARHS